MNSNTNMVSCKSLLGALILTTGAWHHESHTSGWWFVPTHLKNMRKSNWIISLRIGVKLKKGNHILVALFCCLKFPTKLVHPRKNNSRKMLKEAPKSWSPVYRPRIPGQKHRASHHPFFAHERELQLSQNHVRKKKCKKDLIYIYYILAGGFNPSQEY